MKQTPRVTVITRTKNRPALLGRAVRSVLDQTLKHWEMLIVNDGGEPSPVEQLVWSVAREAAGRIRILHNPTSLGMEAASNHGLDAASGDYVVIHDDDDSWSPTFLEMCVNHLDNADHIVGGVVTRSQKILERLDRGVVTEIGSEPYTPGLASITLMGMARANMFPPIAFLFRRSAAEKIGRFNAELPVLGDWEFNLRFLSHFDIDVIEATLANYHIRPETRSGIYSNTVVGGLNLHQKYDARLRNELLRQDFRKGQIGLGYLVNLGRLMNDQLWEIRKGQMSDSTLDRLRMQGITRFAVCGAGQMGRRIVNDAKAQGFHVDRIVDANAELWGKPVEGVKVCGPEEAFKEGCRTFVIASLTYSTEIRASISRAGSLHGVEPRVFEVAEAA
jgi:glycosyltransferase involved in cell wall biosynthesis